MHLIPVTIRDAQSFVAQFHRTHDAPIGALFAVACGDDEIDGVALVGRPVARGLQDGWTAEVLRVCTRGRPNACSMLYAACWRACKALGYTSLVTYTLDDEAGTSLSAAGWRVVAQVPGRSWNCESRPRVDRHPTQGKFRWEAT